MRSILRSPLRNPHDRDVIGIGEPSDRATKRRAHLLHDRRRRNRVTQVMSHERHHLPTDLKTGYVAVEMDPVQALGIKDYVTIQKLIHRQRCSHTNRMTPAQHTKPARGSAVRGAASLDAAPISAALAAQSCAGTRVYAVRRSVLIGIVSPDSGTMTGRIGAKLGVRRRIPDRTWALRLSPHTEPTDSWFVRMGGRVLSPR